MDETTKGESDPFLCFRRREIKSTRKTRRTDAQSLHRLRQLKHEMDTARHIMDMIVKREKMRREALLLEHLIFEQRLLVQEMREKLGLPEDVVEAARQAQRVCCVFCLFFFVYFYMCVHMAIYTIEAHGQVARVPRARRSGGTGRCRWRRSSYSRHRGRRRTQKARLIRQRIAGAHARPHHALHRHGDAEAARHVCAVRRHDGGTEHSYTLWID